MAEIIMIILRFLTLSFLLWKVKDQGFQNSFSSMSSFFILYSDI